MARYTFPAFNKAPTPRYIVLWDMHWHVLDCHRLEAAIGTYEHRACED